MYIFADNFKHTYAQYHSYITCNGCDKYCFLKNQAYNSPRVWSQCFTYPEFFCPFPYNHYHNITDTYNSGDDCSHSYNPHEYTESMKHGIYSLELLQSIVGIHCLGVFNIIVMPLSHDSFYFFMDGFALFDSCSCSCNSNIMQLIRPRINTLSRGNWHIQCL